ncbi:GNAT family N-acetyltransferase [Marinobacter orientalis]|uniref:N-acetyltransferase n=1 Tax=Marinobacter orientalis TaxID=1928859 RepID=A0A7Y0WT62_9GAMM|nr:GNAT family N-acetyltransferase [Marinobacter orientalis]NMT64512.1 N-acetyltransferase [Marinobacter orientalis]TGX51996.1 N-acetyltransferase [Marinobacter orientalis]
MPESGTPELTIRIARSVGDIDPIDWHRLSDTDSPFLRHDFLLALEESGCTTAATGWTPSHLMFYLNDQLAGVAPAYLKTHSMGEYVFDWAWADAYQRYGMNYYPKLLVAIPFTPCRGPRLLFSKELRAWMTPVRMHQGLDSVTEELGAHSWHLLFPDANDQELLAMEEELHRIGCQFHWYNHGYKTFDDFLARLTSRKRKSIRKERRQVADQGISFRRYSGRDIPDHVLSAFYVFYQATYLKRGQRPYLNSDFFHQLRETQPEQLHIIMAARDEQMIAGALFLQGEDTLYGRYWGCLEEFDHLHFETCYYQGIELAIEQALTRFDAGAQGEHKLVRGFEPVITHSWHGIPHPGFREAIARFIEEEAEHVMAYAEDALDALPFRQVEPDQ